MSGKRPSELLTTREKEIIDFISKGLQNKEVALVLDINTRTVEFHVSNILRKLGVNSRFEAVLRWANDINRQREID